MYNNLRSNICSEPMPCPIYCLPKDHKEGELKGPPIHAATDTPTTRLSSYLAKQLNMLLRYVPAHLRNTADFIKFINNLDCSSVHRFCSLDVCNLYGSIPLDDLNENTPSVFTVAKRFFFEHKKHCELRTLKDEDFETLIRLFLTSDSVLIDGESYKQKSGLAMGNNLAPSLAIICMNKLDSLIVSKAEGQVILKRFMDDYFAFLLSACLSAQSLLMMANSLNDKIKFTLETPYNNELPFLDTLVSFDPKLKAFFTKLYIKPIHSRSIMPWDSHGSISSKQAILIGETKRAIACSMDSRGVKESLSKVKEIFLANGYPNKFVDSVIKNTKNNRQHKQTKMDSDKLIYIKLPYINEDYKRRVTSVIRHSGIINIKACFVNGKPLSQVFSAPKGQMNCPNKCETCKSTKKSNQCWKKNVVYKINCSHCDNLYIGKTGRTIGSHIKEHLSMDKQTVFKHIMSHKNKKDKPKMTRNSNGITAIKLLEL